MTAVFIAIFLVMGIMIYFIAVSLRIVIENASKKVNGYFLDKLGEYDEDFREKLYQMENLGEEKDGLEKELRILRMDHNSLTNSQFYKPRPLMRDTYIPIARYIDNGFFEDYKLAKNLFVVDKEGIIKEIMQKFPYSGDLDRYKVAQSITEKLNFDALYDLVSLTDAAQLEVLAETLDVPEKKLLREYIDESADKEHFDLMTFLDWLKQIIHRESPMMTVNVGDAKEDYSHVADNVISRYDTNICEGIRVVYQNKLYDYSIYESRRRK